MTNQHERTSARLSLDHEVNGTLSELRSSDSVGAMVVSTADGPRYLVHAELARGGLGRVFEAYDERLDRLVAIKEMLSDDGGVHRERFEREAAITARLQHPAIVPIYDAGTRPGGTPFYVMKLLGESSTLKEVIARASTPKARLGLLPNVIAVADAIAYAHSLGIIHRDIKPSNVLLGSFGETIVIDWGLAKDLGHSHSTEGPEAPGATARGPDMTSVGTILGTPQYMAPEQARGDVVDVRADVYSLGAMLYHVLSGVPPFDATARGEVLARVIEGLPTPLERAAPGVPPDLIAIVEKAMARDKTERYRDASMFAEDAKRFQTGQLVAAHRYSTGALFLRWLQRYRLPVAMATVFIVALTIVGVSSLRRIRLERAAAVAQRNALILAQGAASLDADPTRALQWLKVYPLDGEEWRRAHVIAADAGGRGVARHILPTMSWTLSVSPDGHSVLTGGPDERVRLWDVATGVQRAAGSFAGPVTAARFAPNGESIAVGDRTGNVVLWFPRTGQRTNLGKIASGAFYVVFSNDGTRLASSGLSSVVLWDLGSGRQLLTLPSSETVTSLEMSRDGNTIAFGTEQGQLELWHVSTKTRRRYAGHIGAVNAMVMDTAGQRLLTGGMDGAVRLWAVSSGTSRIVGSHDGRVREVSFSPTDVSLAASGGVDQKVRLWNLAAGGGRVLSGHTDVVNAVLFSPDGRTLASCGPDRQVRLWDVASGEARILRGHRGDLGGLAFTPDGRFLASSGYDEGTRIWAIDPQLDRIIGRHEFEALHAVFSPDGRFVASSGSDRTARLWDLSSGAERLLLGAEYSAMVFAPGVAFSKDGRLLASVGDSTARVWDVVTGEVHRFVAEGTLLRRVALSGDGQFLAGASSDGLVRLWEVSSGKVTLLDGHQGEVTQVRFSPSGDLVVAGGIDGTVRSWTTDGSASMRHVASHASAVVQLSFARDGAMLASAARDGSLSVWSFASGSGRKLPGHSETVTGLEFSSDGRLLGSSSMDRTARVWSFADAQSRVLEGHDEGIRSLAFSADARVVATGGNDRTIHLWNLQTGGMVILRGHAASVRSVAFDADGRRLVSASEDATVRLWDVRSAPEVPTPGQLSSWIVTQTSAELSPLAFSATAPSGATTKDAR